MEKVMEKYIVTVEYHYLATPNNWGCTQKQLKQTLGVFDSVDEAILKGNELFPILESKYSLNPNYNVKRRFKHSELLISELAYIKTPFSFYAKIEKLRYFETEELINNIDKSVEEYREYEKLEE